MSGPGDSIVALVAVGGNATRLGLPASSYKSLVTLAGGTRFLDLLTEKLRAAGLEKIVLVSNSGRQVIPQDQLPADTEQFYGTSPIGDPLRDLLHATKSHPAERYLLVNANSIVAVSLRPLLRAEERCAIIVTPRTQEANHVLELNQEGRASRVRKVAALAQAPAGRFGRYTGLMTVRRDVLETVPLTAQSFLWDLLDHQCLQNPVAAIDSADNLYISISTPAGLAAARCLPPPILRSYAADENVVHEGLRSPIVVGEDLQRAAARMQLSTNGLGMGVHPRWLPKGPSRYGQ